MGADGSRVQRPLTTQQMVLAEVRKQILTGILRPGDPIRPDVTAAQLDVSRVPVREALKILEGEGQIVYRPHHGYSVAELHVKDLVEIYRIRELLEGEAVRHAVPKLTDEDLARMGEAIAEMEACGEDEIMPMTAANRRFHFTLLEASDMPHLLHHIGLLWNSTDPFRSLYYMSDEHRTLVNSEHRLVFKAVSAGEVAEAIGHLDAHRRNAINALAGLLDESNESDGLRVLRPGRD
jgi:DNA-binding GntR family transcriptional regulator